MKTLLSITCPAVWQQQCNSKCALKGWLCSQQTQLYLKPYLRSPTNNILTSLRIFPGVVNHVGRPVCVQHLCSCLSGWRIQPATSTRPGSLANSYVRISAPVCSAFNANSTRLKRALQNAVLLSYCTLPCILSHSQQGAHTNSQITTQTWLLQHHRLLAVGHAPPRVSWVRKAGMSSRNT